MESGAETLEPKQPWVRVGLLVFAAFAMCCCVPDCMDMVSVTGQVQETDTPELRAAAVSFGKRGKLADCENESLDRVQRCLDEASKVGGDGFFDTLSKGRDHNQQCIIEVAHFHRHCLDAAAPDAEFCARVVMPEDTAGQVAEGRKLEDAICQIRHPGMENTGCIQVVRESWMHCDELTVAANARDADAGE